MQLKAALVAEIDFCPDLKQVCGKFYARVQHFLNRLRRADHADVPDALELF